MQDLISYFASLSLRTVNICIFSPTVQKTSAHVFIQKFKITIVISPLPLLVWLLINVRGKQNKPKEHHFHNNFNDSIKLSYVEILVV
jgi:hypothetical protein